MVGGFPIGATRPATFPGVLMTKSKLYAGQLHPRAGRPIQKRLQHRQLTSEAVRKRVLDSAALSHPRPGVPITLPKLKFLELPDP
jgi:hypothetical protein